MFAFFSFLFVVKVMTGRNEKKRKTLKQLEGLLLPPPSCFIKKQSSEQSREFVMYGGVCLIQPVCTAPILLF